MADLTDPSFFFDLDYSKAEPLSQREDRHRRMAMWLQSVGTRGWRGACAEAGVREEQIVRWRRLHPEFREACESVSREIADRLERTLDEIADGSVEASPTQLAALQFRLRGLRPEVYRDRSSVTVDATTRIDGGGDGGRARLLLAEWTAPSTSVPRGTIVDRSSTNNPRGQIVNNCSAPDAGSSAQGEGGHDAQGTGDGDDATDAPTSE